MGSPFPALPPRVPSPCPCQPRQTLSGFAAFNKNSETFGLKSLLYLEEPQRRERPLLRGGSSGSPLPRRARSQRISARAAPSDSPADAGAWGSVVARGQLGSRASAGGGGPAGLPPRPRLRWAVPSAGGARVPVLPGLDGSFCWLRGGGGCVCAAPRRSPRPPEPGARAAARAPRRRGPRPREAQPWPCGGWGPRCCCCRCSPPWKVSGRAGAGGRWGRGAAGHGRPPAPTSAPRPAKFARGLAPGAGGRGEVCPAAPGDAGPAGARGTAGAD